MLIVQRLAESEIERLIRVRLAALKDSPESFGTTHAEASGWGQDEWAHQLKTLATFVAVVDGRDVGIVRGSRVDSPAQSAYLFSMWVAAEARGKGLGDALVDAVIEWARVQGLSSLFLDVREDNQNALSLYVRKGFRETGQRGAMAPPRENVREFQMVLRLPPPVADSAFQRDIPRSPSG